MKKFLLHLSLATAVTLLAVALGPSLHAQQTSQDPAATAPQQSDTATPQQQQQNEAQMPASGDTTTQDAQAFRGRIVKENGHLVLKDPVSKVSYKLDDPSKVKPYVGKEVKVIGKLDMDSNTIQVDSIEIVS